MLAHLKRWNNTEGPQPPKVGKGDMEALKKELDAGYGKGKVSEIKPPLEGVEIRFSKEKLEGDGEDKMEGPQPPKVKK